MLMFGDVQKIKVRLSASKTMPKHPAIPSPLDITVFVDRQNASLLSVSVLSSFGSPVFDKVLLLVVIRVIKPLSRAYWELGLVFREYDLSGVYLC